MLPCHLVKGKLTKVWLSKLFELKMKLQ